MQTTHRSPSSHPNVYVWSKTENRTRPHPKCFIFWPIPSPLRLVWLLLSKKLTFVFRTSSLDSYDPKNLFCWSKVSKELDFCLALSCPVLVSHTAGATFVMEATTTIKQDEVGPCRVIVLSRPSYCVVLRLLCLVLSCDCLTLLPTPTTIKQDEVGQATPYFAKPAVPSFAVAVPSDSNGRS